MIDLCPVGALTSKPFRYTARTWELARRKSVSPHDSLGSNLVVQMKNDRVMRVLPLENEAINECWLSDKDRFSYEGLNSEDRLTAADAQARRRMERGRLAGCARLRGARAEAHPRAAWRRRARARWCRRIRRWRRLHLAAEARARPGQRQHRLPPAPVRLQRRRRARRRAWLGMPIAEIRRPRPRARRRQLPAQGPSAAGAAPAPGGQERRAARAACTASTTTCCSSVAQRAIVAPSALPRTLAEIVVAAAAAAGAQTPAALAAIEPSPAARDIAAVPLGRRAARSLARQFCRLASARFAIARPGARLSPISPARSWAFFREAANSVGGTSPAPIRARRGCMPRRCLPTRARPTCCSMSSRSSTAADPARTRAALAAAEFVVALSPFRSRRRGLCRGAAAGRAVHRDRRHLRQLRRPDAGFNGVVPPLGEARPAWKVLRVLGELLSLPGFDYQSIEAIRSESAGWRRDRQLAVECDPHAARALRGAAGARRPRAHRRSADLCRRSPGAARAVAAEDRAMPPRRRRA